METKVSPVTMITAPLRVLVWGAGVRMERGCAVSLATRASSQNQACATSLSGLDYLTIMGTKEIF